MKKGFTLIEVLASLVILSIITLITYAAVGNIIDGFRTRAFQSSTDGLVRAIRNDVAITKFTSTMYVLENGVLKTTDDRVISVKGSLVGDGTLTVDDYGNVKLGLIYGSKCAVKEYNDSEVTYTSDGSCLIPGVPSIVSNNWINTVALSPQENNRNLRVNSAVEITSGNEYIGINLVDILGKYAETGQKITISFDVKANSAGAISAYFLGKYEIQNRVNNFGFDNSTSSPITLTNTSYKRVSFTFDMRYNPLGSNGEAFTLSIYGTYGTGRISTVRNIMVTLGTTSPDWSAAPEDTGTTDTLLTTALLSSEQYKPQVYGEYNKLEMGATPWGREDRLIRNSSYSTNLITNANGTTGSNTNFTTFTYDSSDSYYSLGSFKDATYNATKLTTDLILVNPDKTYVISYYAKQNPYTGARYYMGLAPYDRDGLAIYSNHYMYIAGTLTTLAQELKPGDTVVYFTSLAGWTVDQAQTYQRAFIFWNYRDSTTYLYPPETYSRNTSIADVFANTGKNYVNNTITLRAAWTGATYPAGTSVSTNTQGSGYMYTAASNVIVPNSWTKYQGTVSGQGTGGSSAGSKFPYGTKYVRGMLLVNRDVAGAGIMISNASLRENRSISTFDRAGVEIGAVANSRIAVDPTKDYRFSVWVKTNSLKASMGLLLNTYSTQTGSVETLSRVDGTGTTNQPIDVVTVNGAWTLITTYLYNSSAVSPSGVLPFAYNVSGTTLKSVKGFKMNSTSRFLSFSLSAFDNDKDVYFYRPRMDLIDGTEPSIEQLIKGIG